MDGHATHSNYLVKFFHTPKLRKVNLPNLPSQPHHPLPQPSPTLPKANVTRKTVFELDAKAASFCRGNGQKVTVFRLYKYNLSKP